jgi:hypothetical protein
MLQQSIGIGRQEQVDGAECLWQRFFTFFELDVVEMGTTAAFQIRYRRLARPPTHP